MKLENKYTFYVDESHKIHAYSGEYADSNKKKTFIKRVGGSKFLILNSVNNNYILTFYDVSKYLIENLSNETEIILNNISRANVGCLLKLCNKSKEDELNNDQNNPVRMANIMLIEKFGITYDEFVNLPCLEQNELMEQLYENKDENGYKKVMIGSGENAIFVTKQKGDRVMLDDGTFVRVGDNPYQSRKKLDEKLENIVKEEKSLVRKIIKKIGRN